MLFNSYACATLPRLKCFFENRINSGTMYQQACSVLKSVFFVSFFRFVLFLIFFWTQEIQIDSYIKNG